MTRADVDMLRETNIAPEIVAAHDRQRGEAAGSLEFQGNLGQREAEEKAFSLLKRESASLAESQQKLAAVTTQHSEAMQRATAAMLKFAEAYEKANPTTSGSSSPQPGVTGEMQDTVQVIHETGFELSNAHAAAGRAQLDALWQVEDSFRRYSERAAAMGNMV